MKVVSSVLVALGMASALVAPAVADEAIETKEVAVGFNDAYIPSGFDSNSESFVVASGIFPNGCYRWKGANVKHEGSSHEIRGIASVSQGMCLMVLVPFSKEIRLGKLAIGNHSVKLMNGDSTYVEKQLYIEE